MVGFACTFAYTFAFAPAALAFTFAAPAVLAFTFATPAVLAFTFAPGTSRAIARSFGAPILMRRLAGL